MYTDAVIADWDTSHKEWNTIKNHQLKTIQAYIFIIKNVTNDKEI